MKLVHQNEICFNGIADRFDYYLNFLYLRYISLVINHFTFYELKMKVTRE